MVIKRPSLKSENHLSECNIIEEFHRYEKLVAQTYDGAFVMVGEHCEFQTLIRDK